MFSKRLVRAAMLSILLLGVLVASAFAAPDVGDAVKETVKVNRKNVTILWFEFLDPPPNKLTHEMCSYIPEGYEIVNDENSTLRRKLATKQVLPNGDTVVRVRDVVRGTATDNFGDSYNWVYRQVLWIRLDGTVASAKMTDYFRIVGPDVSHELGFKWRWQYTADSVNLVEVVEDGEVIDVYSDHVWPNADGTTPTSDPNYIDGSWHVFYDYGDFWNCDPL